MEITSEHLNAQFENSLESDELSSLGLEISEIALDSVLQDGLLKDIPIVNSIVALYKTGLGIKDAFYIKKLLIFLSKAQELSNDQRLDFLKEVSKIVDEKNRLFEKILISIDKLDDSAKAALLGKVFKHLIVGNITRIEYYRVSRVIEDMLLDEINYFFLKYGYYDHTDDTRDRYTYFMDLIGDDELKSTLKRVGLYSVEAELRYGQSRDPKQYKIEKKEHLTRLGYLFAEFGFKPGIYLKIPI